MWNNLTQKWWKLVLVILATLYFGAFFGFMLIAPLLILDASLLIPFTKVALLVASASTLAWAGAPLFGMGLDATTAPKSFAPYVAPTRSLSRALLYASVAGPAGLITLLVFVAGTAGLFKVNEPLYGVLSIVLMPFALVSLALVSRFISFWFAARVEASQGRRDLMQMVGVVLFVAIMWGFSYFMSTFAEGGMNLDIGTLTNIAKWTPFAGIVSIPYLLAGGELIPALVQVAYGVAIFTVLGAGWHSLVRGEMVGRKHELTDATKQAVAAGQSVVDPTLVATEVKTVAGLDQQLKSLNFWLKLGLNPPTAALAARNLHMWVRDARLAPSLIIMLMMPILGLGFSLSPTGASTGWFLFVFTPLIFGQTAGMLLSYDSTAYWMHVSAGVTGRADRFGRLFASLPALIVVSIFNGVLASIALPIGMSWLALTIASFSLGLLTASLMSAITGYRAFGVQPPGTSAMSTKGTANQMATFIGGLVVFTLGSLLMVPAVLAYIYLGPIITEAAVYLLVLVWTLGISYVALRIGAGLLERNQAAILQQIKSWPGH
ncbi:hypothetical protein [Actinomyces sp.]|uniref:hypothetical protein n=1 Tax=Actinomyces sp. TaxID=29317 RepID=UPI001ECA4B14|nr:hypothetical protein [Actinomyces sp.]MBS5825776.1 hypothetical protein [Actinomyces sp.]MDU4831614.1 hypothetical protein [Actinomyces sp.]MDU5568403.1 hypothetical protein [Actinomyces sp.]